MSTSIPWVSLCAQCAPVVAERGSMLALPASRANRAYLFSSPDRAPLRPGDKAAIRDVVASLRCMEVEREGLPPVLEEGEVAAVYHPFAPCPGCQAVLAEFTTEPEWLVLLSPALATRLVSYLTRPRQRVSRAIRDEIERLTQAGVLEVYRATESVRRRAAAEAERYRLKHNLAEGWYLDPPAHWRARP